MTVEAAEARLVLVVADADAEKFLGAAIRRGIERGCLKPFHLEIRRDPMRDSSVCQQPGKTLVGIDASNDKVLITFDRSGSGREEDATEAIEARVLDTLAASGLAREDIACVVFAPELEVIFTPDHVWTSVADRLAKRRREAPPTTDTVLARTQHRPRNEPAEWGSHLAHDPKDCFDALLRVLRLRHEPAVFQELGNALSLARLKHGSAAARIASHLVKWFGASA